MSKIRTDIAVPIRTCAYCHLPVLESSAVEIFYKSRKHKEWYCFKCWFGNLYKEELERQKWYKKHGKKLPSMGE